MIALVQLLPKDEKFYDCFLQQAHIVRDAASLLVEKRHTSHQGVAELEKQGDTVVRDIFDRLNRTFITPIDPEDIGALALATEQLLDEIESVSFRICAYDMVEIPRAMDDGLRRLHEGTDHVYEIFRVLREKEMKDKDEIRDRCERIRQLAETTVLETRDVVVRLYREEKDCVQLIKLREVYDRVETSLRTLDRFSEIVQNIVAKNI